MKYIKWISLNVYLFPLAIVFIELPCVHSDSFRVQQQYRKALDKLIEFKEIIAPWPWS